MNKKWWKEAIVYQIYPRSFKDSTGNGVGDIQGIISKLDYIKKLGVDVVWLNPVYKSPNDDNGYDISDYKAIHNDFGTMEDWDNLLAEMHKRDIKLIMDLVVNHTSDEHEWFVKSKESKDNKYSDYYHWRSGVDGVEPNNSLSVFGGSAWNYSKNRSEYYLHLFTKKQPDLNWENTNVREEVFSVMKWWLDKGIDGFRMDVINFISKKPETLTVSRSISNNTFNTGDYGNGPKVHQYLKEMNDKVLSKYDIMTVGECPGTTPENVMDYVASDRHELQTVFTFEHVECDYGEHGERWAIGENKMFKLKSQISKWQNALNGKGWNSVYLMNHDQPRALSRFGNDSPEFRELSGKMLATMTLTLQGTPYIYMGEEIGMTNCGFDNIDDYRDIETLNYYKTVSNTEKSEKEIMDIIKYRSRDNSRTPIQWDDTKGGGFTSGNPWIKMCSNYKDINVQNALGNKNSLFYYYKDLIAIRKNNLALVYGDFEEIDSNNQTVFSYIRTYQDQSFFVVLNLTKDVTTYGHNLLNSKDVNIELSNYSDFKFTKDNTLTLRPYESIIIRLS